jgi:DNA-binding Xre family transcriptional regulator
MPIRWNLRKWLAVNHDIYRATELREVILNRAGVEISPQSLRSLLSGQPKELKVSTMEALCTALQCNMSDFCDVVPRKRKVSRRRKPNAAHAKREQNVSAFPSPSQFAPKAKAPPR